MADKKKKKNKGFLDRIAPDNLLSGPGSITDMGFLNSLPSSLFTGPGSITDMGMLPSIAQQLFGNNGNLPMGPLTPYHVPLNQGGPLAEYQRLLSQQQPTGAPVAPNQADTATQAIPQNVPPESKDYQKSLADAAMTMNQVPNPLTPEQIYAMSGTPGTKNLTEQPETGLTKTGQPQGANRKTAFDDNWYSGLSVQEWRKPFASQDPQSIIHEGTNLIIEKMGKDVDPAILQQFRQTIYDDVAQDVQRVRSEEGRPYTSVDFYTFLGHAFEAAVNPPDTTATDTSTDAAIGPDTPGMTPDLAAYYMQQASLGRQ